MAELTKDEFYETMHRGIYDDLCRNHLTGAVADFLANLAVRIEKLERND